MIRFVDFFDRVIESVVVICVILIIGLSCLNIALRWFEVALTFIDPLVRHLVFLSAFLGAVMAIGSDRHIKIDLMQRYIQKHKTLNKVFTPIYFVTILLVLIALSYSSILFTISELEYGKVDFLGIHSGVLTGIIPFGFILMTFRHSLRMFKPVGVSE